MSASPFTHARYREILQAGGAAGYRFIGFAEHAEQRSSDEKACLLRHDCDNDLVAALRMAEIEAEEGVRSTYFVMVRSAIYNLLAPTNAALVRQILGLGHWLGLHFDESVVAHAPEAQVPALVDRERQLLREEFGNEVAAVSFHQPGPRILENRIKLSCLNTYDRGDMAGVHYTSDSNLVFRGGEPSVLFGEARHHRIQILIHPEWWTAEAMPLAAKWDRMLADNFELMENHLLTREDTYTERRAMTLRRPEKGP